MWRDGSPDHDVLERREATAPGRPLLAPLWRDGQALRRPDLALARTRATREVKALPPAWSRLPGPETPPAPRIGPALEALTREVTARETRIRD